MNKPDQQTSVADAEAIIRNLEDKRRALVERGNELATIRASYAYAAHANGDKAARAKLDQVNKETAEHGSELASIDGALATARQKLEAAKQHEAKAADRARAAELRAALKRFVEHGAGVDAALEVLIESCDGLERTLVEIHRCGSAFPSDAQLLSLGSRVVTAALSKTTFRREFPAVPPLERNRSMARITQQWAETVERNLQAQLGDQANETIEAAE
jgi:hypothetical protein